MLSAEWGLAELTRFLGTAELSWVSCGGADAASVGGHPVRWGLAAYSAVHTLSGRSPGRSLLPELRNTRSWPALVCRSKSRRAPRAQRPAGLARRG